MSSVLPKSNFAPDSYFSLDWECLSVALKKAGCCYFLQLALSYYYSSLILRMEEADAHLKDLLTGNSTNHFGYSILSDLGHLLLCLLLLSTKFLDTTCK